MKYLKHFESLHEDFIDIAVQNNKKKLNKMLESGKLKVNHRFTPLNGLIFGLARVDLRELMNKITNIDNVKWTPLMISSYVDNIDFIDILVKNGANTSETDNGLTALMIAAINGKIDAVKKLIDLNADIFYKNSKGQDFLDIASDDIKQQISDYVDSKDDISHFVGVKKYNI